MKGTGTGRVRNGRLDVAMVVAVAEAHDVDAVHGGPWKVQQRHNMRAWAWVQR